MSAARLHCIIVTFHRNAGFRAALELALAQSLRPARIIVVDNGQSDEVAKAVAACPATAHVEYVRAAENLGPAGGTALAMRMILTEAEDDDWITRLDDDLTTMESDVFAVLFDFAVRMADTDPMTAAVGAVGSRYDRRRNRLVRIDDAEIARGPVPVDYVPTNVFPMYRVGTVRAVGTLDERLFYGFSEVEYGLRLRAAGHSLYACPELWQRLGRRSAATAGPSLTLGAPDWRRYYTLRNQIWMLHSSGDRHVAFRVGVVRCLLKPLANVVLHPRWASRHLALGARAFRDGWFGRLGRTVDPGDWT